MINIGLKCWKCMESMFFSIDPHKKEYVLYSRFNIDNYGWPLIFIDNSILSFSNTHLYDSTFSITMEKVI